MPDTDKMRCLLVKKSPDDKVERAITSCPVSELPAGDVLIKVAYSSLNYKDALACTGHPGVVSRFPHVPGIDAAGNVVESSDSRFTAGQEVVVTGFELGAGWWGGYAEFIRVPADWVVPLPAGLSLRESMMLGTAGFTAALCLQAIQLQGIKPEDGDVVVTGATGGVGTLGVAMLAQAGYRVHAVSGKPDQADLLRRLGASEILPREAVVDRSNSPMLKARWAAGLDTVGGLTLSTLLRSTRPGGCIAACGLVGGADLPLTVYPFILRGVVLAGVSSSSYPAAPRAELWSKMAGPWKPRLLKEISTEVKLEDLEPKIQDILAGRVIGRVIVRI
jgi:putative YhdH/YhfP family quinone oxidoreductase